MYFLNDAYRSRQRERNNRQHQPAKSGFPVRFVRFDRQYETCDHQRDADVLKGGGQFAEKDARKRGYYR